MKNLLICSILLFAVSPALASIELPASSDGRVVGLGGVSVVGHNKVTSASFNPALIQDIDKFTTTIAISPFKSNAKVPFLNIAGGLSDINSSNPISPLFFAGAAFKLDSVPLQPTLGLAIYPLAGVGSVFNDLEVFGGESMESGIMILETAIPISIQLFKGLNLAIAPRLNYLSQNQKVFSGIPPAKLETTLSGISFKGVSIGLSYDLIENLQLGLVYKSKVTVGLGGKTKMPHPVISTDILEVDTKSSFSVPHQFKLGLGLKLLENKLFVGGEVRYSLYKNSSKALKSTLTFPDDLGGSIIESEQVLNWQDTYSLHLGVEYYVLPMFPFRIGYSCNKSATPNETVNLFVPPSGMMHVLHFGSGVKLSKFDIDIGGFYGSATAKDVPAKVVYGVIPGNYTLSIFLIIASVTYSF